MAPAGLEAPGSAVRNRPGETTGESLVLGLRLRGQPFFSLLFPKYDTAGGSKIIMTDTAGGSKNHNELQR